MNGQSIEVWVESTSWGPSMAFALEIPGASGRGAGPEHAMSQLRSDLTWTHDWMGRHGCEPEWMHNAALKVVQTVPATGQPLLGDTEGFFDWDARAFTNAEVQKARQFLEWSRADLLSLTRPLSDHQLDAHPSPSARSIREIVDHIAIAECWYTTRLRVDEDSAADWTTYGPDAFERLQNVRRMVDRDYFPWLSRMPAAERLKQCTKNGEIWTARKTLRRIVWHELYHLKQIERRLAALDEEQPSAC
ncbi:MAG: DinB family protein [Phycisphaerales bacterium]|nr:DinB family protein [Phycisphaerales bacterium]